MTALSPLLVHIDQVLKCNSIEEVWALHVARMAEYGFDRMLYGYSRFRTFGDFGDPSDAIILIKHDMGDGTYVCSFYGHIDAPLVDPGDPITRGQAIGTVMQWPDPYPDNNHLHYAIVPQET